MPGFPSTLSAQGLPMPGTAPNNVPLDGPPPSPAMGQGVNPGLPLGSMVAGGPVPTSQYPPQVLQGAQAAGEKMNDVVDSLAQMMPDLAQDWLLVKQALASVMSKVQQAGAPPTSPTATGSNFPGGGMDKVGPSPAPGGGMN